MAHKGGCVTDDQHFTPKALLQDIIKGFIAGGVWLFKAGYTGGNSVMLNGGSICHNSLQVLK